MCSRAGPGCSGQSDGRPMHQGRPARHPSPGPAGPVLSGRFVDSRHVYVTHFAGGGGAPWAWSRPEVLHKSVKVCEVSIREPPPLGFMTVQQKAPCVCFLRKMKTLLTSLNPGLAKQTRSEHRKKSLFLLASMSSDVNLKVRG